MAGALRPGAVAGAVVRAEHARLANKGGLGALLAAVLVDTTTAREPGTPLAQAGQFHASRRCFDVQAGSREHDERLLRK